MDIRVAYYSTKFFERNSAILVAICKADGLVDYLLQLSILEVVADHHFQHLKQLSVWDVTIIIHVVDSKCDCGKEQVQNQLVQTQCRSIEPSQGLNGQGQVTLTFQFGLFVTFDTELRDALNKFFEIYFSIAIGIEYIYYPLNQRILLQLR